MAISLKIAPCLSAPLVILGACLSLACSSSPGTTEGDGGADTGTGADAKTDAHLEGGKDSGHPMPDGGNGEASSEAGPPAGPINDQFTSGTRLKGKWRQTADGYSQLEGIHDSLLDIDCAWGEAEDGMLRCLPTNVAATTYNLGVTFSDNACTVPVYEVSPTDCSPAPGAYYFEDVRTCPGGHRVFTIGATVTAPTTVYENAFGPCGIITSSPTDTYYSIAEAAPTLFVGGSEELGPASSGLAPAFVNGGDGSRTFRTLRDEANSSTTCDFIPATDGKLRCLPTMAATPETTEFVDATCMTGLADSDATSCSSIPFATETSSTGCPIFTTVYALGAQVDTVYSNYGGGCSLEEIVGPNFFTLGDVIAPAAFTAGVASVSSGTSRIVPRVVTVGSLIVNEFESSENLSSLYDTKRKEDCLPLKASDGKLRCLPFNAADPGSLAIVYPGAYSDAACTKGVAVGGVGCTAPKYAYASGSGCGATQQIGVYDVGAAVTTLYVSSMGTCTSTAIPSGYLVYEAGAEVAPSSFEAFTETVH
jgi:hypothetical protein